MSKMAAHDVGRGLTLSYGIDVFPRNSCVEVLSPVPQNVAVCTRSEFFAGVIKVK